MGLRFVAYGGGHVAALQDHFLQISGDEGPHAEFLLHEPGQDGLGLDFAVGQHHLGAVAGHQGGQPVQQLALPCVGGKAVDGENARGHVHVFAEQGNFFCFFHKLPTGGARSLVAHKDDAGPGPPDIVAQVVAHAARVAHAAG